VFERERTLLQTCNKCRGVALALIHIWEVPVSNHVSEAGCVENLRGFSNPYHAGVRIVSYLRIGRPWHPSFPM
jgi:hypothetical protein